MSTESEAYVLGQLNRLLHRDPREADPWIEQGVALYRLGETEEAARCFEAAREIVPDNELVLTNLAVTLAESGKPHLAVVMLRRVLESIRPIITPGISFGGCCRRWFRSGTRGC